MKILNHLQHRQQRAGMVRQGKGKQDDPGIAAAVRQVPLPGEGLLHRLELGFLPSTSRKSIWVSTALL